VATLNKEEFFAGVGIRRNRGYYSFDRGGCHFVVLDACFNGQMKPYQRNNFSWDDANLPEEEMAWLQADLEQAQGRTLILAHQRLDLDPRQSPYAIKQSGVVREILQASGKVLAVLQGHSHENDLRKIQGIPYITLAAMVEGAGEASSAYGIVSVTAGDRVIVKGYRKLIGRESL
jgi:alkaline phosphatase